MRYTSREHNRLLIIAVPEAVLGAYQAMVSDLFGDRLLVIDDEQAFTQIVKRIAESSGYEVVVANDAAGFVNAARLWHPTVIMLDLKMPGTDGIQLLRALAADKCPAHIVVSSGADQKVLEAV